MVVALDANGEATAPWALPHLEPTVLPRTATATPTRPSQLDPGEEGAAI